MNEKPKKGALQEISDRYGVFIYIHDTRKGRHVLAGGMARHDGYDCDRAHRAVREIVDRGLGWE